MPAAQLLGFLRGLSQRRVRLFDVFLGSYLKYHIIEVEYRRALSLSGSLIIVLLGIDCREAAWPRSFLVCFYIGGIEGIMEQKMEASI